MEKNVDLLNISSDIEHVEEMNDNLRQKIDTRIRISYSFGRIIA